MSITAVSGPLVAFGQATSDDYNPEAGPSLFFGGIGILEQRDVAAYNPGQNFGALISGWLGTTGVLTTSFVPSALAANNIAASSAPVSGTAVALVSSTAAGITIGATVVSRTTGLTVTGLLLIDSLTASSASSTIAGNVFTTGGSVTGTFTTGSVLTGTGVTAGTVIIAPITGIAGGVGTYLINIPQTVTSTTISGNTGTLGVPRVPFGSAGTIQLYNPLTWLARNVRITTAAGDTAVYTVVGFDPYGFPQTEAITANGASTVSGKKAFKYIQSVTPVGTVGATITVGTGDVYGFGLLSSNFQDVLISWNATAITASTGYLPGIATTATSTTGDVRGTYAVQSASDGTKQLVIRQSPLVTNVGTVAGLFGVTPA